MNLSTNPLTISASDVAGAAVTAWKGNAHVLQIEMEGYTEDTDTADVNDLAGHTFWHGNGAGDLQTVRSGHLGWCHGGIVIPQGGITHGSVRIYLK